MADLNKKVQEAFEKHFNLPIQLISPDAIANSYYTYEKIESIANWIKERVSIEPQVAIVCGSGLGHIADSVVNAQKIAYEEIPEFPRSTVVGHKGNLVFGQLGDLPVVCMQGRFHPFEGYSLALCTMPIKVFKMLGIKLVILTNAAGSINRAYKVGDLMLIKDHISFPLLSLHHPLVGPNDERFGPRFFPVSSIYSKKLRDLFKQTSNEIGVSIHEGVYGSVGGPTFETVSDVNLCKATGMDVVGMSTTHEATVAAYCGMKVLAFSIVTDKVVDEFDAENETTFHEAILEVANSKTEIAEKLVSSFMKKLYEENNNNALLN